MSPFNDYCLVCEQVCPADSVYCSESCKSKDQKRAASPTLSACSSLRSGHQQQQQQQLQQLQQHNHQNSISSIISPLLTPQLYSNVTPINLSSSVMKQSNNNIFLKSPQFRDLSYDSPMLSSTSVHNDLDSNRLDLNASSLYHQLHHQQPQPSQLHQANILNNQSQDMKKSNGNGTATTAQVSDLLSTCASENYKIWLSIH